MKIQNRSFPSKKYLQLKRQWLKIGPVLNGSISQVKLKCGKKNCACYKNPKAKHGHYPMWTTKKDNKTVAKFLSPVTAKSCQKWIQNYREAERLLNKMLALSFSHVPWKGVKKK